MTNANPALIPYVQRWIRLDQERRDRVEDLKELGVEMRSNGFTTDEVSAVRVTGRRTIDADDEKVAARKATKDRIETIADSLELAVQQPPSDTDDAGRKGS